MKRRASKDLVERALEPRRDVQGLQVALKEPFSEGGECLHGLGDLGKRQYGPNQLDYESDEVYGMHHLSVCINSPNLALLSDKRFEPMREFARATTEIENSLARLGREHAQDGCGGSVRVNKVGIP